MGGPDANCYQWDSYLGKCKQWHSPEWWEYVNLLSISAFVGMLLLAALLVSVGNIAVAHLPKMLRK